MDSRLGASSSASDDLSLLACSGDQVATVHTETPMRFDAEAECWRCPACGREVTPKMLRDSIGVMPWEEPA